MRVGICVLLFSLRPFGELAPVVHFSRTCRNFSFSSSKRNDGKLVRLAVDDNDDDDDNGDDINFILFLQVGST